MPEESQPRPISLEDAIEGYDSKFRYVLLASNRAEQLVRGARPKLTLPGKKPTRVAMQEVLNGMIPWDYGPHPDDIAAEAGDAGAAGEGAEPESGSDTQ